MSLRDDLLTLDLAQRPAEQAHRARMLALLDAAPDCFLRSCFPAHFTGSALVVSADRSRVLLHHHRKLGKWMQFGGHCDGDSDLLRVAQREAWEESGVEGLTPLSALPIDLDIHEIPARPLEPAHYHYDIRYRLLAPEGAQFQCSEESLELRWFTREELGSLALDEGLQRLLEKAWI